MMVDEADLSTLVNRFNREFAKGADAEILTTDGGQKKVQIGNPAVCPGVVAPNNPVLTPSDFVLLACRLEMRPGRQVAADLQVMLRQIDAPAQSKHWLHLFELFAWCDETTQSHLMGVLGQLKPANLPDGLLGEAAKSAHPQVLLSLLENMRDQQLPELPLGPDGSAADLSRLAKDKTILPQLLEVVPDWLENSHTRSSDHEAVARDAICDWLGAAYSNTLMKQAVRLCFDDINERWRNCGMNGPLVSPKKKKKGFRDSTFLSVTLGSAIDGDGLVNHSLFAPVGGPMADSSEPGLSDPLLGTRGGDGADGVDGGYGSVTPPPGGQLSVQVADDARASAGGGEKQQPQGCCTIL